MKQKKPTMKEVVAKVEMLNRVNTTVIDMIDNLGNALKQYIEFKDDAKEVKEGLECGIGIEDAKKYKEGDLIEAYEIEEIKRTLE